jgi:hypothetical protein
VINLKPHKKKNEEGRKHIHFKQGVINCKMSQTFHKKKKDGEKGTLKI